MQLIKKSLPFHLLNDKDFLFQSFLKTHRKLFEEIHGRVLLKHYFPS